MIYKIRYWIPLAFVITAFCGLVYLTSQQNYRQSANDPQIQRSEDMAQALSSGKNPEDYYTTELVDISKSLSPFFIIYDETGRLLFSNSVLDGKNPELPKGVLESAKKYSQNRVTWEPKENVRIAAVVTYFSGKAAGFVLVGRSLREVEIREVRLEMHIIFVWIATMVGSAISVLIFTKKS